MNKSIRLFLFFCLLVSLFNSGCAVDATGKRTINTQDLFMGIGAVAGGAVGAIADDRKPLRGGVIGAVGGALAGYALAELQKKAVQKALEAKNGKSTIKDEKGNVVEAEVVKQPTGHTECKTIRIITYENGDMKNPTSEKAEKICEEHKITYHQ